MRALLVISLKGYGLVESLFVDNNIIIWINIELT